jgi:hypothetical protein
MVVLASFTSWAMFALGVVLMIVILLRRSWRYQRRARNDRTAVSPRKPPPSPGLPLSDAPDDVRRWNVELHDTIRDAQAEMDSKMRALQSLIMLADQQTRHLEAAVARAERLGIKEGPNVLAEIEQMASSPAAPLEGLPPAPSPDADHVLACRERIHQLAAQGLSAEAIAAEVAATVGEVELMLRLPTAASSLPPTHFPGGHRSEPAPDPSQ